jgi:uncharacterized repeat protein (TIGR02543 family)
MKKLTLTSVLALFMSCPAFAATGIGASANSASCDNGVLGTYEGSTTLQAQWGANTIHLNWYNDSEANNGQSINVANTSAASCLYDGAIALPEEPTKTGYDFAGWRVRTTSAAPTPSQPQQTTIELGTLFGPNNICTNGTSYGYAKLNGAAGYDEAIYGLTQGSGEWATVFSYGTLKGQALCSSTPGIAAQTGDPTETGGGRYCWCKSTGFDAEKDKTYVDVSSSSWVFLVDEFVADDCADGCAHDCARNVQSSAAFRGAMFGVSGAEQCNNN